jgi:hypothetical protein
VAERQGTDHVHEVTRRLRSRCEAIYGVVFYTPEATVGAHGLDPVQWYMAGRCAPLGAVSAAVATAVLGTFNPRLVSSGLDDVWSLVTPSDMASLKLESAVAVLGGVLPAGGGELARATALLSRALDAAEVAGHPLFAGLSALPRPSRPAARFWRLCDLVREHRSDAHVNAWRSFGFDPVEINMLNELWRQVTPGSIARELMGWSHADMDAGMDRLVRRDLVAGGEITSTGREVREEVERVTSAQQASLVEALGGDASELLGLLDPWARAAVDSHSR